MVRIDAPMQIGEVSQVVDVTAQTPLIESDTTSLGQVIEGRTVQQVSLNGRNVMNLIALAPGVVPQGQTQGNPAINNVNGWGNIRLVEELRIKAPRHRRSSPQRQLCSSSSIDTGSGRGQEFAF